MPNQPSDELIPECVDAQLPSGARLRFCFDEPLMTSDAGLLLLAEHAAHSGDIARIATALAPKLKAPAPGERYLLLRGKENLTPAQQPSLEEALKWNEPLSQAHYLKEELRELWSQPSHAEAASYLQAWILKAMNVGLAPLKRLATTLLKHAKSILNYFHPISSGNMEGINNKIGRLTRLAYGYRDTEFMFLKILSLHESTLILSGV